LLNPAYQKNPLYIVKTDISKIVAIPGAFTKSEHVGGL
jgi:hypothetical protein